MKLLLYNVKFAAVQWMQAASEVSYGVKIARSALALDANSRSGRLSIREAFAKYC